MSESHQRQLLLFAEDPDKYLDSFSEEFMEGYTSLLKRRFGTKRVHANNVYQEYIQDRDHVHMNATQWETLTDFVKWLGREGYCIVDETEKGWYVSYVDRDPETIRRQEQMRRKEKFEKDEEERMQDFIDKQIELGRSKGVDSQEPIFTELQREDEGKPLALNISLGKSKPTKVMAEGSNVLATSSKRTSLSSKKESKKRCALDDIMEAEMNERKSKEIKSKQASVGPVVVTRKDLPWLQRNIVVKIISKDVGSRFYKLKGVVSDIQGQYVGILKLLECGTVMKLDQSKLETVIPAPNRKILILNGKYKGREAVLKEIQESSFSVTLLLDDGKVLSNIPYEDISKLHIS
ncbi:hypothetical protein SK128_020833 [Halocaridina rubra]|uniref:DNA/RNA-binding protein Kin17 WH-like domain-containing protein n=1 Tax=Halocaridina rubra TaxID=373956 RepID=A0AAN8XLA5_HALRR